MCLWCCSKDLDEQDFNGIYLVRFGFRMWEISYILILLSVCDTTILLQKHFMTEPAFAFSMAKPTCGSWWQRDTRHFLRSFVTKFGSITEGRPGLARHPPRL
jgi:hypothetical protein